MSTPISKWEQMFAYILYTACLAESWYSNKVIMLTLSQIRC